MARQGKKVASLGAPSANEGSAKAAANSAPVVVVESANSPPVIEDKIAPVAEIQAVVEIAATAPTYPCERVVKNNTPSDLMLPSVGVLVRAYCESPVVFLSKEQMKRFENDARQLCELNGWQDGIVIEPSDEAVAK